MLLLPFVSLEQPEQPQIDIEQNRENDRGNDRYHQQLFGLFALTKRQNESDEIEQSDDNDSQQCENAFHFFVHEKNPFCICYFHYKGCSPGKQAMKRFAKHLFM